MLLEIGCLSVSSVYAHYYSQIELASVGKTKSGEIYHHIWDSSSIDELLKAHDLLKSDGGETTEQALGSAGYAEQRPGR